jgi:hypothetical protein
VSCLRENLTSSSYGEGLETDRVSTQVPRQSLTRQNRIKELHDLQIDRTRGSDFWANQFRVLLTAAAYVLMQELRLRAARTNCARSGLDTPRTAAETGRSGTGFGAPRGRASARFVSLPVRLPASGAGAGCFARLAPPCQPKHPFLPHARATEA